MTSSTLPEHLSEKLELLPDRSGVYLFRNAEGDVIYVGKAVNLKHRVRSYFHAPRNLTAKTQLLVAQIADLEHIITDSEVEALILESNLIKKHRPKYNVRLRDDKQYPLLKVTVQETWPRVLVVRQRQDDGARYFGPFVNPGWVRDTLHTLRRVFPYRSCSDRRLAQGGRPCLYYHIHRCLAPCVLDVQAEYRHMIVELVAFLDGKENEIIRRLEGQMSEAAHELQFERAAELRDRLRALRAVVEKQKITSKAVADRDVIALARGERETVAQIFFVRAGKVDGREGLVLAGSEGKEEGEVMAALLEQYYADQPVPREILLSAYPDDAAAITAWLTERRGGKVRLIVPRRGEKRQLIELVATNARQFLEQELWRRDRRSQSAEEALAELQEALDLDGPPRRIECYDISNTQGSHIVAAMTVLIDGRPKPSEYRRFRIQTVQGTADDFASLREVLERRFRRLHEGDEKFDSLPDLILIDGGKGQLSAARGVLRSLDLDTVPTFGLAKENEWLFQEGHSEPIVLPKESGALQLLQRVRDEAHRFGLTYHRRLRGRSALKSILDEIPGVGPRRRKALMQAFASLEEMVDASVEEIAAVRGIPRTVAEAIRTALAGARATGKAGAGEEQASQK